MKVREPVARPLDIVSLELLLSGSQAFLTGILVYLAVGIWDDRGVGLGPTAVILALVGLAIGASWLYWLLGGMGWPMAASNTPAALFLGFALLLGWQSPSFVRLEALPLLLGLASAIYGVVCGVFLDSPRRWRWDQRQRLRPGTQVPRVSPGTKALVAKVPRSLPRREASVAGVEAGSVPGTGQVTPAGAPAGSAEMRDALGAADEVTTPAGTTVVGDASAGADTTDLESAPLDDEPGPSTDGSHGGDPGSAPPDPTSAEPKATDRLSRGRAGAAADAESDVDRTTSGIELPTSVEPKAQRSPWAWAAPPDWNRDEDEEPPRGGTAPGS